MMALTTRRILWLALAFTILAALWLVIVSSAQAGAPRPGAHNAYFPAGDCRASQAPPMAAGEYLMVKAEWGSGGMYVFPNSCQWIDPQHHASLRAKCVKLDHRRLWPDNVVQSSSYVTPVKVTQQEFRKTCP